MNKLPKKLVQNKLLVLAIFLLSLSFYLGIFVSKTKAQVPSPYVSCSGTRDTEFHSLRPYQQSPCDEGVSETAVFCGNQLVISDSVSVLQVTNPEFAENCVETSEGRYRCTYNTSRSRNIAIDLSGAELPIVGNTEDVINSQNQESDLDAGEKVNDYVSWYLNGISSPAEYGYLDPEDEEDVSKIVDFSGPINRLLPQRILNDARVATINQATVTRHNQIIGCVTSFGEIVECSESGAHPVRLTDFKRHTPPKEEDYDTFEEYWVAYKRWRGDSCLTLPILNIRVCFDNPLKPNYWGNLFAEIPLSSTEDRVGLVETKTIGVQSVSDDVNISNVTFSNQEPAELFFAHMQETTELAKLLQSTFVSADGDWDSGATAGISPIKYCDLTNIRTNPGDDLFAGEIAGILSYSADFSCNISLKEFEENGFSECKKDVVASLSLITETPKADELWSRTVAGASAIFKRIFPKVGSDGAILGILDIPAATKVSYSGENVSAGNPSSERSGESAELYFPHIGSVSEYFLKGIQTILRPKGFGEQIISGQAGSSVACGEGIPELPASKSACSACPDSYIDLPPSMRKIFESAGSYYNVPASVLFAIFYNEGAWDRYDWTEDLVINSSGPNCEVPNCSSYSSASGATGPFSFISNHWEEYKDAVLDAGINDGREPNMCNLLDTAFAAAKKLAKERGGGVYEDPICAGITMNQLKGPSSSCSWSDADIVTAARQYLGYCEDPEHPDPVYKPRSSCISNPITCYQKNVLEVSRCRY